MRMGSQMRELRFERLSDDGSRLVLVGKDGQRWSVVIDERIEAAVRRDRARLGQVELEQDGQMRPREIQARIRAGATAEDVAAASGLPLERIRRFEGPVLTERAYMAQQAGSVPLRGGSGDTTLAQAVTAKLVDQGLLESAITWDSWRTDEGLWTVIATFPLGPNTHVATWTYDPVARTTTPVDDNAEDLSIPGAPARLHLVATRPALAAVAEVPSAPEPVLYEPQPDGSEDPEHAQEMPIAEVPAPPQVTAVPSGTRQPTRGKRTSRHPSGTKLPAPQAPAPVVEAVPEPPAPPVGVPDTAESEGGLFESQADPSAAKPRAGRAAVPSFDDILFGPAPKQRPPAEQ